MNGTLAPLPSAPTRPRRSFAQRAGGWWNQLSIYLPVLLMGVLALGSYWVVSQSPGPAEPRPPRPVSADPDYFMRNFAVRTFAANGQLKSELRGSEMRHYPADSTIEVEGARLRAINDLGRVTTASARQLITNDTQTLYTLSGDVIIVREALNLPDGQRLPRLEFRGETITFLVEEDTVLSDQPVRMMRDADRMQADSLRYNDNTREAILRGRVQATLNPRR